MADYVRRVRHFDFSDGQLRWVLVAPPAATELRSIILEDLTNTRTAVLALQSHLDQLRHDEAELARHLVANNLIYDDATRLVRIASESPEPAPRPRQSRKRARSISTDEDGQTEEEYDATTHPSRAERAAKRSRGGAAISSTSIRTQVAPDTSDDDYQNSTGSEGDSLTTLSCSATGIQQRLTDQPGSVSDDGGVSGRETSVEGEPTFKSQYVAWVAKAVSKRTRIERMQARYS